MSKSQQDTSDHGSDWGLGESGRSKGSQIRIALIMIASLIGALGYFVYRKYEERRTGTVQASSFVQPDEQESPRQALTAEDQQLAPNDQQLVQEVRQPALTPTPAIDLFAPVQNEEHGPDVRVASGDGTPEFAPQVGQSEPSVVDWPVQPAAEREPDLRSQNVPGHLSDFAEQPVPLQREPPAPLNRVNDEAAFDLFAPQEEPPAPSSPAENEAAFDLFAPQEEPTAPQPVNPFERAPDERSAVAPGPVNPFVMTPEPESAPPAEGPASDPFSIDPPAAPEPAPESWDAELPSRPRLEPLTVEEVQRPAAWADEPDVIRVDSDEQIEPNGRPPAGFANPFFLEDEPRAADPEPSAEPAVEHATLDFGNPGQPFPPVDSAPALPPSPAPTTPPPIDWSSPADESTDEFPSSSPAAATFETVPTPRSADNSDPFAFAADSSSNATDIFDDADQVHTVQPGDSYWSISRRYYGAGRYFRALAAYNRSRIADPDDLRPGMKVLVPEADVLREQYQALLEGTYVPALRGQALPTGFFMSRDGQPMYRVGKNDTLSSIAEAHLGRASRWRQIYGMNRDRLQDADHLQPGMELRLPADASQSVLVSPPMTFR